MDALAFSAATFAAAQTTLLNVSYDVSREFYKDYNTAFAVHYKKVIGKDLKIDQPRGGSSAQAHAVSPAACGWPPIARASCSR